MSKSVWEQFIERLDRKIKELKLEVTDRKGWVILKGSNGHRVCVQKAMTKLPVIQSTFLPSLFEDGDASLVQENGAIVSQVKPATIVRAGLGFVEDMLEMLNDSTIPLVPPRRGGKDSSIPSIDSLLEK